MLLFGSCFFIVKEWRMEMSELCVNKKEASKLLGVSVRQVDKYLHSGKLTVHHRVAHMAVMIDIVEIYNLREKIANRKRGKTK